MSAAMIGGSLTKEVDALLSPPFTSLVLSPAASAVATQVLTTAMRFIIGLVHANPCTPPPPSPPHYLDLSSNKLLQKLTDTVHNTSDLDFDAAVEHFTSALNKLYDKLFKHPSEHWPTGYLPLPPLAFATKDEKLGDIRIDLANITLTNFDSLYGLDLSTHKDAPQRLSTAIALGNSTDRPLIVHTSMHLQIDGKWHALEVQVYLSGLLLSLAANITIDTSMIGQLTLGSLLHPKSLLPCLLRPIKSIALEPKMTTINLDGQLTSGEGAVWRCTFGRCTQGLQAQRSGSNRCLTICRSSQAAWFRSSTRTTSRLFLKARMTRAIARGAMPQLSPPSMPPPSTPPSALDQFAPMFWGCLAVGSFILLVALTYVLRHAYKILTHNYAASSVAEEVNSALIRLEQQYGYWSTRRGSATSSSNGGGAVGLSSSVTTTASTTPQLGASMGSGGGGAFEGEVLLELLAVMVMAATEAMEEEVAVVASHSSRSGNGTSCSYSSNNGGGGNGPGSEQGAHIPALFSASHLVLHAPPPHTCFIVTRSSSSTRTRTLVRPSMCC